MVPESERAKELKARVMRIPGQVPLGNLNQADAAKFIAEIERRISAAFDEGENCVPIR
jgi:hypothetical protein